MSLDRNYILFFVRKLNEGKKAVFSYSCLVFCSLHTLLLPVYLWNLTKWMWRCFTYCTFFSFNDEVVIFERQCDNVPVRVFACMVPRRDVFHVVSCESLYNFRFANISWSIQTIHQLKSKEQIYIYRHTSHWKTWTYRIYI